jgi:transposase
VRGKERADDRRVISGILHVLRSGCRWKDWSLSRRAQHEDPRTHRC